MFKIQFIGNVGADATLKQFENSSVINFSVAVTETHKGKDGQKQEVIKWIDCEIWNRPKLHPVILKGTMLFVNGTPEVRAYMPKEGKEPKAVQVCRVDELDILSKRPGEIFPFD